MTQRDEKRCEEWRRFLPIGLENIYDAEVDEQFVFPVCPGRDAAHPGTGEKQRELSCCSSAAFETADAAAQMFAKETPAVISIPAPDRRRVCVCVAMVIWEPDCVHWERSVSGCITASAREEVAIARPAVCSNTCA